MIGCDPGLQPALERPRHGLCGKRWGWRPSRRWRAPQWSRRPPRPRRGRIVPVAAPRADAWIGPTLQALGPAGCCYAARQNRRGNGYLRKMLIHGAGAALPVLSKGATPLGSWLRGLMAWAYVNTVIVALAAKLARIICAVLSTEQKFEMQAATVSQPGRSVVRAHPARSAV